MLKIRLLGPFEVWKDNQLISGFKTDYSRALLTVLAARRGETQRREALASMLWPDTSTDKALKYFRVELNRLRPIIGDKDASPPYFDITRKEILFTPESEAEIDAVRFDQLVAEVKDHSHRTLAGCPSCIGKLEEAVSVYRGEFLTGFALKSDLLDSWLTEQREGFRVQFLDIQSQLIDLYEEQGAWERVTESGQAVLQHEPWRESAYQSLMRAAYQLGDRNAALAYYEACEKILYEELGVDPSDETLALHHRISQGQLLDIHDSADIPNNLPPQTNKFFGRSREKRLVLEKIVDPATRFLTLTGFGGIGKSRLSIDIGTQILNSFPDGVWFIPLADIESKQENLLQTIAEAVGLASSSKDPILTQLTNYLRSKQMCLILDNVETHLDLMEFLPGLMQRAPKIAVLCTSREALRFSTETVINLTGLGLEPENEAGLSPALGMFEEHGQKADGSFNISAQNRPAIERICTLLEGSPLGIALAAAWIRRRSPQQILDSIQSSMDFLTSRMRDLPSRHRSMRAVFTSSWEMLSAEQQELFASLSIFQGTFTEDAVEAILGVSIFDIEDLCDKSLVDPLPRSRFSIHPLLKQFAGEQFVSSTEDDSRFTVHHTLKQFASENLDEDLFVMLQNKHSHFYLEQLIRLSEDLIGRDPSQAAAQISNDLENIRQAWKYAGESNQLIDYIGAIEPFSEFFRYRGRMIEGETVLAETSRYFNADVHHPILSQIYALQAGFLMHLGRLDDGLTLAESALTLAEQGETPERLSQTLLILGEIQKEKSEVQLAQEQFERGLAISDSDGLVRYTAEFHRQLGLINYQFLGQFDQGKSHIEKALTHFSTIGHRRGEAQSHNNLGLLSFIRGENQVAESELQKGLAIHLGMGNVYDSMLTRYNLGLVQMAYSNYQAAEKTFTEIVEWQQFTGNRFHHQNIEISLGTAYIKLGLIDTGRQRIEQTLYEALEDNNKFVASFCYYHLGNAHWVQNNLSEAQRCHEQAIELCYEINDPVGVSWSQDRLGNILTELGKYNLALEMLNMAILVRQEHKLDNLALETKAGFIRLHLAQGDNESALALGREIWSAIYNHKSLEGSEEPLATYETLYGLFDGAEPETAGIVLDIAFKQLQSETLRLETPSDRERYINAFSFRKTIWSAGQEQGRQN